MSLYIQYLIHWLLCRTPFTRITFLNNLFQSLSQYGLFQNPGLHTCFGLNLNRGLNKTNVFASKPSFTQRAVLHKNCVIHKHHVLHKNHVLAGPVQGLFAAYRIALSMVAGGTRKRIVTAARGEELVWFGLVWFGWCRSTPVGETGPALPPRPKLECSQDAASQGEER